MHFIKRWYVSFIVLIFIGIIQRWSRENGYEFITNVMVLISIPFLWYFFKGLFIVLFSSAKGSSGSSGGGFMSGFKDGASKVGGYGKEGNYPAKQKFQCINCGKDVSRNSSGEWSYEYGSACQGTIGRKCVPIPIG